MNNLFSYIKLGKRLAILKLKEINFTTIRLLFFLGDVDIEKVRVSNKNSFGEKNDKYFIGYLHNGNKVKPLNIMLPKTSTYVKSYDRQTKWMYFLIEDDDLLEKYNTIWDKVSADIKKEFDSEPVYNKNYLKTKIKSHGDEVTDFYDQKIPKLDSNHTCLAVISLDSALKKDDNYYPQVFLKECKYIEKKVFRDIKDNLKNSLMKNKLKLVNFFCKSIAT